MINYFHSLKNKIGLKLSHLDYSGVLLFSSLIALWSIWYIHSFQPFFYGDELYALQHSLNGSWMDGFHFHSEYKPRWASNALITTLYRNFSNTRSALIIIAISFQIFGSLVFYASIRIIGLSKTSSFLITMATAVSRFNLYCVYEANLGLIEGSAWLFFAMSLYFWILYIKSNNDIYGLVSTIFILLSGLSHERYLPIALLTVSFQIIRFLITGFRLPSISLILSIILPFSVFIALLRYMPSSTLSGTGGVPVSVISFHTLHQITDGIMQVLGVNRGPSYLSGEAHGFALLIQDNISIIFLFILIVILYRSFAYNKNNIASISDNIHFGNMLIFPVYAFISLVFIASISIRQEMRWLQEPLMILIIITILFILKYKISESIVKLLAFGFFFSSMTLFQSQSFVYYASAGKNAESLGRLMQSGIFDTASTKITSNEEWTFQGDLFMSLNFSKNKEYISENRSPYFSNSNIEIQNGKISLISINNGKDSLCDSANNDIPLSIMEEKFHVKQLLLQNDWSKMTNIVNANQWTSGKGCALLIGTGLQLSPLDNNGVIFQKIHIDSSLSHIKCLYEARTDFYKSGTIQPTLLVQVNWLKNNIFVSADQSKLVLDSKFKFQEVDFSIPAGADSCLIYIAGPEINTVTLRRVYVFSDG
jgi:hypothetical protein